MQNQYYTVNQVANILNISKQAVYQRIKKNLSKYIINTDTDTILLDKAILNEFTKIDKPIDKDIEIATLKEKLIGKDDLITNLTNQVNTLTTLLTLQTEDKSDINAKLIQLIEQNNELNKNNQILIAQLQNKNSKPLPDPLPTQNLTPNKPKSLFNWFK